MMLILPAAKKKKAMGNLLETLEIWGVGRVGSGLYSFEEAI